jgi:hypothetical protein
MRAAMYSSSGNKRPLETIDLTGSSPPPKPSKSPRFANGAAGGSRRDQLRAEVLPQSQPPLSQAIRPRHEENSGNELVDDIDAYYGDDIDCMFELYGRILFAST